MKRTPLRKLGKSQTSEIKRRIQAKLRELVIHRDGGCILRDLAGTEANGISVPRCGGYAKDDHLILQADHLITRSNSATFADPRLVVALCKAHHGWKSKGDHVRQAKYDSIVRQLISPERRELWDKMERLRYQPKYTTSTDWRLAEVAIDCELNEMEIDTYVST